MSKTSRGSRMCQLPSGLRRQDGYDLGAVLSDSPRRRQNQIVWITYGHFQRIQFQSGGERKEYDKGVEHDNGRNHVEGNGDVKRDEQERSWRPSLYANQ